MANVLQQKKNRGSQVLICLALLLTGVGAVLSAGGSVVGFVLLPIGVIGLIAGAGWAIKNWDF